MERPFPNEPAAAEGWVVQGCCPRGTSAVQPHCSPHPPHPPGAGAMMHLCRKKAVYFEYFSAATAWNFSIELTGTRSIHLRLISMPLSEEAFAVKHTIEGRQNQTQENDRNVMNTRALISSCPKISQASSWSSGGLEDGRHPPPPPHSVLG